ncbi:MAG: hypothetical protein ACI87O_001723, partial [Planctomycetota bacterium]
MVHLLVELWVTPALGPQARLVVQLVCARRSTPL